MMIAPIDRKIPWQPKPNADLIDRAVHGMMDTDGNGQVGRDEWARTGRTKEAFALFDADGNGQISEDEFAQTRKYEREFNEKDDNGTGFLGRMEFEGSRFIQHLGGGLVKAVEKGEAAVKDSKEMVLRCIPPFIRDRFASFDRDGDGKVSREEYVTGRRREDARPIIKPWLHQVDFARKAAANE